MTSDDAAYDLSGDITLENTLETLIKTAKKLFVLFVIYLLGFYEFSVLWAGLFLTVFIFNKKWKEERRMKLEVARAMAMGYEREILLNSLQDLPSWVRFPDVEKVEWLNRIFKQFWLTVDEYLRDSLPRILEPAVQHHFEDFKFDEVVLGHVPLRVDGVKVYDQESGNKIVMDLDVSYAGDCYVTFKTYKFTGGIKDIQLHGRLRVVLTPLINRLPIIGGVQVYFMNEPRIDFDLIKVTSILDIPVIRTKIKNTIMKIINSMFLFPNVYSLKLAEGVNMSKLTIFKTEGILRVHVVEAKNLVNKDIIGKSDPYVVLTIGSVTVQTPVIQNTLNPKWDFWTEFEAEANSDLKIRVWDRDEGSNDESLGRAKIDISSVAQKGEDEQVITLQDVNSGTIYMRLTWFTLSPDYGHLDAILKENEELSPYLHSALLVVYLESSEDLQMLHHSPPSSFVELQVERTTKVTDISQKNSNPLWDKGFTFMLTDPKRAILDIRVREVDSEKIIGDFSYKVDNLRHEPHLEFRHHKFLFTSQGCIFCSMKLRIFKRNEEAEEQVPKTPTKVLRKQDSKTSTKELKKQDSKISQQSVSSEELSIFNFSTNSQKKSDLGDMKISLSYSDQRQKLLVVIHEATFYKYSLKSPSDYPSPYVKLYLQTDKTKNTKLKTKTVKFTTHPMFHESFDYLISSRDLNFTRLLLVVECEGGLLHRKKFLGQVTIDLTNCDQLSEPFTEWFNLKSKDETDAYVLTVE